MTTQPKLLLIRGMGHSGTTLLDLALGAHSQVQGFGEAVRLLRKPAPGEEQGGPARLRRELRHERLCTCGRTAAQCPVWGPLLEWLPSGDHLPLVEKWQRLAARAVDQAPAQPPLRWIVDSYQSDLELLALPDAVIGMETRVVFLVRDVRSWVHGIVRRQPGKRALGWRSLARWRRTNGQLERRLQATGKPVFLLGYEELALAPEAALSRLCHWLGLSFEATMLTPGTSSGSHILSGNRMRFDPVKSASIRYDSAWLNSPFLPVRLALVLPGWQAMNRRLVYSNQLVNPGGLP